MIGYFLFYQYLKNFFFAVLGFFSGIILDRSSGFFRFPPTTLELKLYPKSSVGSGFSFFFWRLAVLKMHAAHLRRVLWSPKFSFPYFSFNILRPSSSSFAIHFLRGQKKKLEWWLAVAGMCPGQTCMNSAGLFRPFIQPFSAVWAANNNTIPVPKSHTLRRNQNRMITDLKHFASKHPSRNS